MESQILNNIVSIRKNKGFSQEYMANELKMEQSNYGKIERKAVKLTVNQLEKISEIFNLRIIDIITYPSMYVDPINYKNENVETVRATLQIELTKEKKEQVLKLVFGDNNLEILNR
jgi:transcriptional regulator with XRE-family HTH domain